MPTETKNSFKDWLLRTAETVAHTAVQFPLDDASTHALEKFLTEPTCMLLRTETAGGSLSFTTTGPKRPSDELTSVHSEMCFVKTHATTLDSSSDSESVAVVCDASSKSIASLYQLLHQVYLPRLEISQASGTRDQLHALLSEFDSQLGNMVRKLDPRTQKQASGHKSDDSRFFTILKPSDELEFWRNEQISESSARSTRAAQFVPLFESFAPQLDSAVRGESSLPVVLELVQDMQNALDDLWKVSSVNGESSSYPQVRMQHLFDCISSAIASIVQGKTGCGDIDIWNGDVKDVRNRIRECIRLCEAWLAATVDLTSIFWPTYVEHVWMGEPYQSELVKRIINCLNDIVSVRLAQAELLRLIPRAQCRDLKADTVLSTLQAYFGTLGSEVIRKSLADPEAWVSALTSTDTSFRPLEDAAVSTLRDKINASLNTDMHELANAGEIADENVADIPREVFDECSRFSSVLDRKHIRQQLQGERERILAICQSHLERLEMHFQHFSSIRMTGADEFDTSELGSMNSRSRFSSRVIDSTVWARSLRSRVVALRQGGAWLLRDLSAWTQFTDTASELEARAVSWQKQIFRDWCTVAQDLAREMGDAPVGGSGKLMEFDARGNLVVNYSQELVTLLRDTRQLSELGFKIPESVQTAVKRSVEYYRFALTLKQIAQFYNTMGTQIIPTQKPMLFEPLKAFEQKVEKGSEHTNWTNLEECASFVESVQKSGETVSLANRKLRKAHANICRIVVSLINTDMLRQRKAWTSNFAHLKEYVGELIRAGKYDNGRVQMWLQHWDWQLYKAIESGYRFGLESLNEHLGGGLAGLGGGSTLRAELAVLGSQGTVGFKPALEELRSQYYRDMRRFIAFPASVDPLSKMAGIRSSNIFLPMGQRNSTSLAQVYRKAEILFARLGKLRDKYEPWAVVGFIHNGDVDTVLQNFALTGEEVDSNLKSLRGVRKELERLPDVERVDCISVSLTAFKSTVSGQLSRLADALLWQLRRKIDDRLRRAETFLEDAADRLNRRPTTVEEMAEAQETWTSIAEQRTSTQQLVQQCDQERRMLLSIAASTDSTSLDQDSMYQRFENVQALWTNFQVAFEAFHDMIEEQRYSLKERLQQDLVELNKKADRYRMRWGELNPAAQLGQTLQGSIKSSEITTAFNSLEEWSADLATLESEASQLQTHFEQFNMPKPMIESLELARREVDSIMQEWDVVRKFAEERQQLEEQDWISFRARVFELQDFAMKWLDIVKSNHETSETESKTAGGAGTMLHIIRTDADRIRRAMPGLKFARGEPFKEEHWMNVFKRLDMRKTSRIENLTAGDFMQAHVLDALCHPTTISWLKDLHGRAQGEVSIREALQELRAWAETAEFSLLAHFTYKQDKVMVIKEWTELFSDLGDNQSLLGSLKDSPYFKPFADQAIQLENKLAVVDTCLALLNSIQRRWIYLEPIFGRGALPSETPRFRRVHDDFCNLMTDLSRDPKVMNLADEGLLPGLPTRLKSMSEQLDRCMKALNTFLEQKRSQMPRFYFLGDDDLLEILGRANDPNVIQTHLKKLFQGIHSVRFTDETSSTIDAIFSSSGECIPLSKHVRVTEEVTTWLNDLSHEMFWSIRSQLADAVSHGRQDTHYISQYCSQVLCIAEAIHFTRNVENALQVPEESASRIEVVKAQLQEQLKQYTAAPADGDDEVLRAKIKCLVLDIIHYIDVCGQLLNVPNIGIQHWQWQKQLRFYLRSTAVIVRSEDSPPSGHPAANTPVCVVSMCDAEIDYSYEYQGNAAKLVYTPLTDKCYLTLTQGISVGCGGNPYGPAGTGKTESVKALGNLLGRQVLVFNCDEGIDFTSMGRIFTGLVKCGAWGCFDEFNRLKADQLSAVSGQIQVIQAAIKDQTPTIELLNEQIKVNPRAGIFVTMNPAGKAYGGRSKLPDNLKALFRPVAMSRPDNELIAETLLFAEGFKSGTELGKKVVSLFSLASQLLSIQQHYDWGLRAMKTILNTAGAYIRSYYSSNGGTETDETSITEHEKNLLIKAIRVNTMSKLTKADTAKFDALLGDIFPNALNEDVQYHDLKSALQKVMQQPEYGLQVDDAQLTKIQQLKESLDQRMGCVLVGPSGSGKSVLWKTLRDAMRSLGQHVVTHVMDPKSMPRHRLLGWMDPDTREWHDGVLTAAARSVVREPSTTRCWIVCDGDIDPEWIESLNSVLDDNHLLTLPNGERISFGSNVNFIFESHDLKFASPATISRMGMIFLSSTHDDIDRIIESYISRQSETDPHLPDWIKQVFVPAFHKLYPPEESSQIRADESFAVCTTRVSTVFTGLSQLQNVKNMDAFSVCVVRGLGSNLPTDRRESFARFVFEMAGTSIPDFQKPLDCCIDDSGLLRKYSTVESDQMDIDSNVISNWSVKGRGPAIWTPTFQRALDTMKPWMEQNLPFLITGPAGCGKSLAVESLVATQRGAILSTIHCNALTSPDHVIERLHQVCVLTSSSNGRVFRPRSGNLLVLYLKDIDLPVPDKYETCPLIAFLRQLTDFQGFYDENLEFLRLEKVLIVVSTSADGTGRHMLSTRFTSSMRILYMDPPSSSEMEMIADFYLRSMLQAIEADIPTSVVSQISKQMTSLYNDFRAKFSPNTYPHYTVTPRDLIRWIADLVRYNTTSAETLLAAITYEGQRKFRDMLATSQDRMSFDTLLQSTSQSISSILGIGGVSGFTSVGIQLGSTDPEIFSTLGLSHSEGADGNNTVLERITMPDVHEIIERKVELYEREERALNLVLLPEVIEHMVVVDHVLSRPGGSLLLVGAPGVGRRSAVALMAHANNMLFRTPSVSRGYTQKSFFNELRTVLLTVVVDQQPTVFLVEDHHFEALSLIADSIDSLLSSGEVPGLWTHDELELALGTLREELDSECTSLHSLFVHRVRRNLHMCICMSSDHPHFSRVCQANPSFFSRTNVCWFGHWTKSSLSALPVSLIPEMFESGACQADATLPQILHIHQSAGVHRGMDTTPLDYVTFLKTFEALFQHKSGGIKEEANHLDAGLRKLHEAEAQVDKLAQEASEYKSIVSRKQAEADAAMAEITQALEEASSRRHEVKDLQRTLAEAENNILREKEAIDNELSDVQPILDAARAAVGQIKSDNLNEIRSLKAPPAPIADVLSAVLKLLGIQDTSWLSMKRFLGTRGVKEQILQYDARSMAKNVRNDVQKLLKDKASSFDASTIQRVSKAAAPMAGWVKANVQYSTQLEKVAPLEEKRVQAEKQLESSRSRLEQSEREIGAIDERVVTLKDDFRNRTAEAEKVRADLTRTQHTLDRAQSLLDKLSGEKQRWESTVQELHQVLDSLPARMLVAAGVITYLGASDEDVRRKSVIDWCDKCGFPSEYEDPVNGLSFRRLLVSESEILEWKSQGLPGDILSIENGAIIQGSRVAKLRSPFVIDPSGNALKWMTTWLGYENEASHTNDNAQVPQKNNTRPVEVVSTAEARFQTQLELAVRFGKILIVRDVDTIDPMLFPLLRREFYQQGARLTVTLGDKTVDFNEGFELYMVTANGQTKIPPNADALVNQVNFTVTRSGLQGQLLGVTIGHEKPELEQRKTALLANEESLKLQLTELERGLIKLLADSQGDILENEALMTSLTETKRKASDIAKSLDDSASASKELDRQRSAYEPFAKAGASIYFLVSSLQSVNYMYKFSLKEFRQVFQGTLANVSFQDDVKQRIQTLIPALVQGIIVFVGRSLFKEDRLTFALHVARGMHPDEIPENEWGLFSGDVIAATTSVSSGISFPDWTSADRHDAFNAFSSTFPELCKTLNLEDGSWYRWTKSAQPELDWPSSAMQLSPFQRILVLQTFRPDRLISGLHSFVNHLLHIDSVDPPAPSFQALSEASSSDYRPVLMVTTAGADPSTDLREYALSIMPDTSYREVAMGGGQQQIAMQAIRDAARAGMWICLKNVHLVIDWLPMLDKELSLLASAPDTQDSFRLWMTTEAHDAFPLKLLEQSLKVTFEAPPGLKKNLLRTYDSWPKSLIEHGTPLRAQLLFLLAWFHGVVQERRTYIPQGWTKAYEFSFADLRAAVQTLDAVLGHYSDASNAQITHVDQIPWIFLRGLLENAIYGGRVDNGYDARVLRCYLRLWFNSSVLSADAGGRGKSLASGIKLPHSNEPDAFRRIIASLPERDEPNLFHLPANIDRSVQRSYSQRIVGKLRSLKLAGAVSEGSQQMQWRKQLSPLLDLWEDLSRQMTSKPASGGSGILSEFVRLEHDFSVRLCNLVASDLQTIQTYLFGSASLSDPVHKNILCLLNDEVPASWSRQWSGEERLRVWLREIVRRRLALEQNWMVSEQDILSKPMQLSELFRPQAYLSAIRQATARANGVSTDSLKLVAAFQHTHLSSSIANQAQPLVATLSGMFTQGGVVRDDTLQPVTTDANDLQPMPQLFIAWVPSTVADPFMSSKACILPVYSSPTREQYITRFSIPVGSGDQVRFILAGAAIVVQG